MICHSFTISRINLPPKPCIYVYNFLTSWLSHFHRINGSYANIPYPTHNHTQLNHSKDITTERLSSEISQVYAHCRLKSTFRRYITQNIFQQLFFVLLYTVLVQTVCHIIGIWSLSSKSWKHYVPHG